MDIKADQKKKKKKKNWHFILNASLISTKLSLFQQTKRDKGQDPKSQEIPSQTPRTLDPGFQHYLDVITSQPDAGSEITGRTDKTEFDLGFLDILTVDSTDSMDQSLSGVVSLSELSPFVWSDGIVY